MIYSGTLHVQVHNSTFSFEYSESSFNVHFIQCVNVLFFVSAFEIIWYMEKHSDHTCIVIIWNYALCISKALYITA